MVYLVLAVILLLIAAVFFVAYKAVRGIGGDRIPGLKWGAIGTLVVLGLLTLGMSITTVGARSVGIQTAFGRYQDTLANGLQLTAPWSSVEEFSTQVQYLDLDGDQAVPVTFKGGGGGEVNATPRWRIDAAKAENLWKKYRTFENVRDKLVNSSAKDSVRIIASRYTPNDARSGENLRKLTDEVQADLGKSLADDGVLIDSISIKGISLDERSQSSLDKIVEANNYVERAKAEQERARIEAETAKIRQQNGALSGPAITMKCLEILDKWSSANNGPLPAGFVCPGTDTRSFTVTDK
ncbi:SPFH domain-containing protein [Streptomyces sp. NPDC012769]|uniref:SPFH domain-containing protein n=1 Tax=Streptomyces sp. NPDC012769 TaxID=3364848 RepID=UPI003679C715